ncbi:ARS binding protein 2 [Geosmithia morbida]|uniref:ARS binding protein 2 n=1 Tax=Geosmithia morbida TaxID=1094350 RepID=A0A9P4YXJ3_9HYPO|nr:ARS binding protein 2 [Geosmithia morbida]KAF4123880.1 ARS binding protein 2 [Geosmithia morbida]
MAMETVHEQQQTSVAAPAVSVTDGSTSTQPVNGLPDRNVTPDTLEDAFVSFIFYCNPAIPWGSDATALREAFRTPPKNGGKSFDTAVIYDLVKRLYAKDIKTWTELTMMLGVAPPDPSKDESRQRITQYGKWMNSLHVKSFFEYLMGIPNEYWNNVPDDPDPASQPVRDGVAVEDDMVLRALIPHMRPKRGRKRPDEAETPLSAQRPRLSPSSAIDSHRPGDVTPWLVPGKGPLSAHPDAVRSAHPGLGLGDGSQTPFSRWPNSAITPTVRGAFWDDDPTGEPRSAMSPSYTKIGRQRRGTKNVSSAWRVGGPESRGKTRGRPPVNRTPVDAPGELAPRAAAMQPVLGVGEPSSATHQLPETPSGVPYSRPKRTMTAPALSSGSQNGTHIEGQRPARPSISLQVPQRTGGAVRLATPPPPPALPTPHACRPPAVVILSEEDASQGQQPGERKHSNGWPTRVEHAVNEDRCRCKGAHHRSADARHSGMGDCIDDYHFERTEDRTNVDMLLNYFMRMAREGDWVDADGRPAERPAPDEMAGIVNAMVEDIYRNSPSPETFLVNLGALAGARMLMPSPPKYSRLPDGDRCHKFAISWEYRFSSISGAFSMTQVVPWSMWRRPSVGQQQNHQQQHSGEGSCGSSDGNENVLTADDWKRKYEALQAEMGEREKERELAQATAQRHHGKDATV